MGKCRTTSKGFVAYITLEWLLAAMSTFVSDKMACPIKGFVTLVACKTLTTAVCELVSSEAIPPGK